MLQKTFLIGCTVVVLLWLFLLFSKYAAELGTKGIGMKRIASVATRGSESERKIDGIDRFEWYRRNFGKEPNPNATRVSSLYAYEFPHEYTVSLTSRDLKGYRVFCRYLDMEGREIGKPFESLTHPEYTVPCEKRAGTVKIGVSPASMGPFVPLPIVNRVLAEPRYQLAMCMTPLYGTEPKWLLVTEMIEHYKLQGVEHFYMYIHNASNYDLKVINDYVRTGDAEVHYLLERDQRTDDHWQMVHIADCVLRSRAEARWTLFSDLDERVLMADGQGTIRDFVRGEHDATVAGFVFRQQWVLKTELMPYRYQGSETIDQWMPSLRWHNSTGIGPKGHTTKCIIDTSRVFEMWVHWPTTLFPGHAYWMKELEPSVGVIRHYRDQSLGDWGRVWLKGVLEFGALRHTVYPKRYQRELTENVKIRTEYVYGNKYD